MIPAASLRTIGHGEVVSGGGERHGRGPAAESTGGDRDRDELTTHLDLGAANAGSEQLTDAYVIAAAVDFGGSIALTNDSKDRGRLAASYRNVIVIELPGAAVQSTRIF